jgi:hypothetical protein
VRAWEDASEQEFHRLKRERLLGEAKSRAEVWARRVVEQREVEWELSRLMSDKARELLTRPLDEQRVTVKDAATLLNMASRMVRLASVEQERREEEESGSSEVVVRVEYADPPEQHEVEQ